MSDHRLQWACSVHVRCVCERKVGITRPTYSLLWVAVDETHTVDGVRSFMIISGGQTGVDRGALAAALAAGSECGGWCPAGRRAEDGIISERFPLKALPGAGYLQRTLKNVIDSDGTLLIVFGAPSSGTGRTLEFCRKYGKPNLILNATLTGVSEAVEVARPFIIRHALLRLNVAGPRASHEPRGYDYAFAVVTGLIQGLKSC